MPTITTSKQMVRLWYSSVQNLGEPNFKPTSSLYSLRGCAGAPVGHYQPSSSQVEAGMLITGGFSSENAVLYNTKVYIYPSNYWIYESSLPGPTAYHTTYIHPGPYSGRVAQVGFFGGYDGSSFLSTNIVFDYVSRIWSFKADLPSPRAGLMSKHYDINSNNVSGFPAIGGTNSSGYHGTFYLFDFTNNIWYSAPSMPTPRAYGGLIAASVPYIFGVAGGRNNSGILNTVEVFNPLTSAWSSYVSIPEKRAYFISFYSDEAFPGSVIFGGYDEFFNPKNTVFLLSPTGSWTTLPTPMPSARGEACGGVLDVIHNWISNPTKLYKSFDDRSLGATYLIVGGKNNTGTLNINELFRWEFRTI